MVWLVDMATGLGANYKDQAGIKTSSGLKPLLSFNMIINMVLNRSPICFCAVFTQNMSPHQNV